MRRTKVYRPRRGIRFANGRTGGPVASFVAGSSVTKTAPTSPKVNWVTKTFKMVTLSGSIQRTVQSNTASLSYPQNSLGTPVLTTSSVAIEGSVSFGRQYEKRKYSAILLGQDSSKPVGALPFSDVVQDSNPTGTFVSPSWTHASIGSNQAFVAVNFSSSFVETKSLNYFLSGTEPLESSPVPASSSLFYSKQNRFQTIVVKKTASLSDTIPWDPTARVPATFSGGVSTFGTLINTVTGTNVASGVACDINPAMFKFDVPVTGKLVNIRIWVEFIHSSSSGKFFPLGSLGLAIKSPNVRWGNSHPIRNDPDYIAAAGGPAIASGALFYRDTFILWEPPVPNPGGGFEWGPTENNGGFDLRKYPLWQRDRDMRTIFSDGAPVPNPRHLYVPTSPSGNYNGSPNSYNGTASNAADALNFDSAYGLDVPWTSNANWISSPSYAQNGSPPKGWLNGPGGTNDVNEYPTTGFNFGAHQVRPLYPLLDSIYAKKVVTQEGGVAGYPSVGQAADYYPNPAKWRGFRPGLRGTEISGSWILYVTNNHNGGLSTDAMFLYFLQARLEITYDTGIGPNLVRRSTTRAWPARSGERYLYTISGTAGSGKGSSLGPDLDYMPTQIFTVSPAQAEVGRTFGVILQTGSYLDTSYSLIYKLSGVIADASGSAPGWLLNNQFGMPAIPESSASISPRIPQSIKSAAPVAIFFPKTGIEGPRKLSDVVRSVNPPKTMVDLASDFVSGALT